MLALAACGRLDFAPRADAASADADPNGPRHRYRLAGDFHDDAGGPDLVPLGGTVDATGYTFAANQGLRLVGAMPPAVYTVMFEVALNTLTGWRKLLDYKELATDEGLYTYGLDYQFVIVQSQTFATSADLLTPMQPVRLAITRDAAGVVIGYIGPNMQISFTDDAGVAVLAGATANFFIDDNATGGGEADGGVARDLRIWDRALAPAEIAALP